jgi:IS5 family transposase
MKRTILTLTIAASLLSVAPVVQARDHWDGGEFQSDVHSLWEWYGHLRDEADHRGGHHAREQLDSIRGGLEHVDHELHDGHYRGDRVRSEIDGLRDDLHRVNDDLKWHGEVHHREGFTIQIR